VILGNGPTGLAIMIGINRKLCRRIGIKNIGISLESMAGLIIIMIDRHGLASP
jgi:hypothetical protein